VPVYNGPVASKDPAPPRRFFPSTIWTDVLGAGDRTQPDHRTRLEALMRTYWTPVFAYIRTAWSKQPADASDLTQAFFVHLLEKDYLARLTPGLGSFRGYLKRALRNFLIDAERSAAARRPTRTLLSMESSELDRIAPAAPDETPDHVYDREWSRRLLDAAIEDLRATLEASGRSLYFEVFKSYFLQGAGTTSSKLSRTDEQGPTYDDVARRLKIKEADVRNHLHACRKLLKESLRRLVRDYVESDDEVESELEEMLKKG